MNVYVYTIFIIYIAYRLFIYIHTNIHEYADCVLVSVYVCTQGLTM